MNAFFAILKFIGIIIIDLLYDIFYKLRWILLIGLFSLGVISYSYFRTPPVETIVHIKIPKQSRFKDVSDYLLNKGLIKSELLFKVFAKSTGYDRKIRFGEFKIPTPTNEYFISKTLLSAKPVQRKLTIIEGLRYSKVIPIIANTLELDSNKLSDLATDSVFLAQNGVYQNDIEGYLQPETYYFNWGITERDVLSDLISRTKSVLNEHAEEIKKRNLTEYDILIMASIIQGECIYEDEMSQVSSVYWNRIRQGWKLGADPTIQYFLDKPKRLLFSDLRIKHPYNTYMYKGLPPGPINNPGKAAIVAAIYPKETEYMFFVSDGKTGRHIFGKTAEEHERNKAGLKAARLKLWREKRKKALQSKN